MTQSTFHPAAVTRVNAYIGLGANLNHPVERIRQALAALRVLPDTALTRYSRLYRTAPLGQAGQPDYINAVAAVRTGLSPDGLLDHLFVIEKQQGRVRNGTRWGPRTLDLDLLLHGDLSLAGERLTLPHPQMHKRAFVLVPLAEIAATGLSIPGHGDVRELAANCDRAGVCLIDGQGS